MMWLNTGGRSMPGKRSTLSLLAYNASATNLVRQLAEAVFSRDQPTSWRWSLSKVASHTGWMGSPCPESIQYVSVQQTNAGGGSGAKVEGR